MKFNIGDRVKLKEDIPYQELKDIGIPLYVYQELRGDGLFVERTGGDTIVVIDSKSSLWLCYGHFFKNPDSLPNRLFRM